MTGELKCDRRQELLRSTRSEAAPPSRAPASRKLLDREDGAVTEEEEVEGRARLEEAEEEVAPLLLLSPDLSRLLMLREVPLLLPPASLPLPPPLPEPEMGRILRKLEAGLAPPPPAPPSSSLLRPLLRP